MKTKLSEYMNIKRIEFIVTWQCGGKCKHCQIGDGINQRSSHRHVLGEYAADAVKKIASAYDVTSVMTFGGEPLYYPDVTAEIHKATTECGIKTRQIITNGYFTNNGEKSSAVAKSLADAGVNNLLLSADGFHQEYIPIEPVYRFAQDVLNAKIPGFRLHPAWLVDEEYENMYNSETRKILQKFSELPIPVSRGNNIFLGGHAAKYLREHYEKVELDLSAKCGTTPHTEPLTEVSSISIVPNGDVMICGFVIGNIYDEDVLDVIARYDPYKDEAMRPLIEGGVSGLLAYASAHGVQVDTTKYCDACDICHAVVEQLKI
ncbi:MAG: radical SAM protein [Defluviitaleaceae bacterium]|nr:radical SAM protein [Defluviitaleaceae bacterium]